VKIPINLGSRELIKALKKLGYEVSHQTGSHIRLTTQEKGEHNITIPAHNLLKIGTLNAILKDIGNHFNLSRQDLLNLIDNK
jgi:predicted RNA binding protein YcfA (HicA-like mRNA interferase family)